jgi:hypothetical protein
MARPRTDEGFIMIALDLFAAIAAADLPNRCQVVLAEVLMQVFGPRKDRERIMPVKTTSVVMARATGLDKQEARKALHDLVTYQILTRNGDEYTFQKDYETWRIKGQLISERRGGAFASYIHEANKRNGKRKPNKQASVVPPDYLQVVPPDYQGSPDRLPVVVPPDYLSSPARLPASEPPPEPPHIGTHAIRESIENKRENKTRCASHARGDLVPAEPAIPDDPDPELEQDHANRARFVQHVRNSFGSLLPLETWLSRYSHEYDDTDRAIRAVNEVKTDIRAGIKITSIGGAIRSKYQALANGAVSTRDTRGHVKGPPGGMDEAAAWAIAKKYGGTT